METIFTLIEWFQHDTMAQVLAALLALSEALAAIPALKANSVLQLITSILRKLTGK